jgi:hypothetical protein
MKIALDPYMFRTVPLAELPGLVADLGYRYIELSPREDVIPFYLHPRWIVPGSRRSSGRSMPQASRSARSCRSGRLQGRRHGPGHQLAERVVPVLRAAHLPPGRRHGQDHALRGRVPHPPSPGGCLRPPRVVRLALHHQPARQHGAGPSGPGHRPRARSTGTRSSAPLASSGSTGS